MKTRQSKQRPTKHSYFTHLFLKLEKKQKERKEKEKKILHKYESQEEKNNQQLKLTRITWFSSGVDATGNGWLVRLAYQVYVHKSSRSKVA